MSYSAMVHEANVLATRVSQLERTVPDSYQRMLTEANGLSARAAVLEGSSGKMLPSQAILRSIGGWQLSDNQGLGFSSGGLLVEKSGSQIAFYSNGHLRDKQLHKSVAEFNNRGTDFSARKQWPMSSQVGVWQGFHPVTDCYMQACTGICRPRPGGTLLASSYSGYATESTAWVGPYLSWIDETLGPVEYIRNEPQVLRPVFAGGFVRIPQWFADAHLQGRSFGIARGGYHSGQASAMGPSLFVCDTPDNLATQLSNVTVLLQFCGMNGPTEQYERRPGDYTNGLWVPEPDVNGLGYFQSDITAGPVWIDTPTVSGLCYWTVQGTGTLDYALQKLGLSNTLKTRLYVYSPETIAAVASGDIQPWEARATFSEWENPFDANSYHYPIGADWYDGNLYVSYYNAGQNQYEPAPVVVAYELTTRSL